MAPSGRQLWNLETQLVPEKPSIAPRGLLTRSDLVRLGPGQERPNLSIFCRLERISRDRGSRSIFRKSKTALPSLRVATSAFLRILNMLCLRFANALTHRTSEPLSRRRETHASKLSKILDALARAKTSQVPSQESKVSQPSPYRIWHLPGVSPSWAKAVTALSRISNKTVGSIFTPPLRAASARIRNIMRGRASLR
jgi:hypothetical protein